MMSCVNVVLRKTKAADFGAIRQVMEASVAYGYELRQVWTL